MKDRRRSYPGWTLIGGVALLVAMLLPARVLAQAGPPYQTDDPDPVEYRHWEFYLATQSERVAGNVTGTAPHVEVNLGAAPRLQLHVLVPFAYTHEEGGQSARGVGDVEVGAKIQLVSENWWRPMVGTFVQTEWPSGNAGDGLGTGHLHVLIPLWLQKSFGQWSTDLGGGYWVNPGDGTRDYWSGGWQVQRHLAERATVGAELFYTGADQIGGAGSLRVNTGVVANLSEQHHLLFSLGHSVHGPRVLQGYLAYQLTVGPTEAREPSLAERKHSAMLRP